jgi:hypothetical protein
MKPNCNCVVCTKPIYRIPCRKTDHPLCSYACRNKYFSGEKSFVWKGGDPALSYKKREKERNRQKKLKAIELLGGSCLCCGYKECSAALEFHHVNPADKDKTIKEMIGLSWEKLLKEVKKCVLLCVNHHREVHYLANNTEELTLAGALELVKENYGQRIRREAV